MEDKTTYTIIASSNSFELSDADAFANVASGVLGDEWYNELLKETAHCTKGVANDRITDMVMAVLNRPIIRFLLKYYARKMMK